MTSEKKRPKPIESQFVRLKECEEKIRQRILAELDDINRLLENTKDKYEHMDENISDAEFTSKVIYLTERQNVEGKKSRRFSPAQVYEQAVFEAYFRIGSENSQSSERMSFRNVTSAVHPPRQNPRPNPSPNPQANVRITKKVLTSILDNPYRFTQANNDQPPELSNYLKVNH